MRASQPSRIDGAARSGAAPTLCESSAYGKEVAEDLHHAVGDSADPESAGSQVRRGKDGFEGVRSAVAGARPLLDSPLVGGRVTAPMAPRCSSGGALHVLDSAKDPGIYFQEHEPEGHRRDEDENEDSELAAAIEECIRLLFGVRGIQRVGPGTNEAGETVIVITPMRGFTESSMRAIPDRVHRFKTLVALPFDLLPLRRDLS